MAVSYRTRQIQVNQVFYDQIDIFQADFFSRVPGLLVTDVVLTLTLNNTPVSWPLVDGSGVTDGQVTSGFVYWAELTTGGYGVRLFPNSLGHWNLSIAYAPRTQIVTIDFDVVNLPLTVDSGIRADFCV